MIDASSAGVVESMAGNSVILDCGAHSLRAGYANEDGPRLDIPALVGHPRHRGVAMAAGMNELDVGEEALVKRGMLSINCPIKDGIVQQWDDMEKLWSHLMFSELRVTPESHCFITTLPVNAPAAQKEKTLELMMETFHVHSLFQGVSQVLSLYSYGLTTGLVLDSGKDRTLAVPVHEGYALGRHVTTSPVAGEMLTNYLGSLLKQLGYGFDTAAEKQTLNQAKEDLCFVRPTGADMYEEGDDDDAGQFNSYAPTSNAAAAAASNGEPAVAPRGGSNVIFELAGQLPETEVFYSPDGQAIPLRDQRYRTTDVLFDFSLLSDASGANRYDPPYKVRTDMGEIFTPSLAKGISWLPYAAIHHCEPALRAQLFASVVLAGNTTAFPGTRDRVEEELVQLYREHHSTEAVTPIHVRDLPSRGYTAWLGGAIIARTSLFPHLAVSRKEYEEEGLRVVHCKSL